MRIGVLGCAQIAPRALIEPARAHGEVEVAAVAARDPERAEAFAKTYGIEVVHPSYEALVCDSSLDAVYIPLPNSLHFQWAMAALREGRHVLCEKPLASNGQQAKEMVATARHCDRLLVEAFHWRYHPLAQQLISLAQDMSPLGSLSASFEVFTPSPDIRHDLQLGGGSFMDLGCYCVHMLRCVTGIEPIVLSAEADEGAPGVDLAMTAQLSFAGTPAIARSSMSARDAIFPESMAVKIDSHAGHLEVMNPMAPQLGHRLSFRDPTGAESVTVLDAASSYYYQLAAFHEAVVGNREPLTGGLDAIGNMTVIDEVYNAAGLGPRL